MTDQRIFDRTVDLDPFSVFIDERDKDGASSEHETASARTTYQDVST